MDSSLGLNLCMFLHLLLGMAYVKRCLEFEPHFLHSEQYAGLLTCLQMVQLWDRARASGRLASFAYLSKEERKNHRLLRGKGIAMSFHSYTCEQNVSVSYRDWQNGKNKSNTTLR